MSGDASWTATFLGSVLNEELFLEYEAINMVDNGFSMTVCQLTKDVSDNCEEYVHYMMIYWGNGNTPLKDISRG